MFIYFVFVVHNKVIMNYQLNLESANGRVKRAKTISNYNIEAHYIKPFINNKEYIFEILPIGVEMFDMALCSKSGVNIQDLIEGYCLFYDDNVIGIRDEAYFTVRYLFERRERINNCIFLDYPNIPVYFLTKNLYLKVVVKQPILDLVLHTNIMYKKPILKNTMMFKMYDYKLEKISISVGINQLNIVENKHIEFIILKTSQDLNNISLETGLRTTKEQPKYYKYTVPYYESLTPQKDMYLIPLSCNPLLMNKCYLLMESSANCDICIIFVSLVYLQYDEKGLKNMYEVSSI